ncbi:hypothetical protein K504DRAFT_469690 [Pleomassaria siparia CBS 279.74]|uniref:Uncharacterized protein n=1 Tax=Pleomassaria siparia CBS 279.74 TaxID=1314801 RepID=A0A6G1KRQ5_9PLEO|nr:hypothetical protein K504DRAFT_469690 [Pleomassaria siparia CBS 279.74]
MFGRRRASSAHQNQAPKSPPSASASLAATKAFTASNASLASAAAAASLRTHKTNPTPVGDTITKRMVRRGSTSSHGSASANGPGLRRHSSSGSMTERSFRSPSPNGGSPVPHNAPPVPSIPRDLPSADVVHRRTSSLDPPFRGASTTSRGGGRGVSLDRGGRDQAHTRIMSLSQVPEDEQDGGPRSVNFSRPMSPQQTPTPPLAATSSRGGNNGWFGGPVVNPDQTFRGEAKARPQTSSGMTRLDTHNAAQNVQNAADRPVSTRTPQMARGVEGSRLSSGSMRVKSAGTNVSGRLSQAANLTLREPPRSVDPNSPYAVYDPSTRTFIHKQDAMDMHRELSQHDEERRVPQQRISVPTPNTARQVDYRTPTPPPQYVQRAPSPVEQQRGRSPTPPLRNPLRTKDHEHVSPTAPEKAQSQEAPGPARQSPEEFAEADTRQVANSNPSRKLNYASPEPHKKALAIQGNTTNQDNTYSRVGTPLIPAPTNTGPIRHGRNQSLSPPRNAHFAATSVDLANGVRHQPPPRSVSPAKSALKPSHSVSRRDNSPTASDARAADRGAPSEASDTMSEDGAKKKKRTVRVSFDEEPHIAGTSAYSEDETPTSPPGLGASRWSSTSQEQDLDNVMKPRPALPLFGSIREMNRRPDSGESPEKVTETVSSSMSTSIGSIGEASNDHALGSIVAQDFANKMPSQQAPSDPLPPEVTSVEGNGYMSDSDQGDTSYIEAPSQDTPNTIAEMDHVHSIPELEPKTLTTPAESNPPVPKLPVIAIQLATPIERPEPKFQRPFVPGGWADDDESETETHPQDMPQAGPLSAIGARISQDIEDEPSDDNSSVYSDAYEDLSEDGGFASIDAVVDSPAVEPTSGLMFSKYAESNPVEPPKSSLKHEVTEVENQDQVTKTDDWDAARQHWSGLSSARKQSNQAGDPVEHATFTAPVPAPVPAPVTEATKVKTPVRHAQIDPASRTQKPLQPSQPAQPSAQPRKSALKKTVPVSQSVSAEPHMRKTMRGNSESDYVPASVSETRMRKSMRGSTASDSAPSPNSGTHMRKSMRGNDPLGNQRIPPGLAASRFSTPPPLETRPLKGALQKKNIPSAMHAAKARPKTGTGSIVDAKPKAPAPAYDSDSDASASSFQRQRPHTSGGMRSSMRSGPAPTMRPTPTMRPISPPPAAGPPSAALRKSMRPSSPTAEVTASGALKSNRFSLRSLSPAGRFRSSKIVTEEIPPIPKQSSKKMSTPAFSKPAKAKAVAADAPKSRFKSRFADSSDSDEEEIPRKFQSRFADSDDDEDFELPPGLAPVRGIPRKSGEEDGDSTDLEDEASDNDHSPVKGAVKNFEKSATNGNTNGQGEILAAGSLRDSKHAHDLPTFDAVKQSKSKRGFFGLGKKKAAPSNPESELTTTGITDIPFPPAHRNHGARPLTPIGENKSIQASEPPSSRSPKLQRRSTPQWSRSASDSWPLPQPPQIGEELRPQSADGVIPRRTSMRPTLSKGNSSQTSTARPGSIINPKSGKTVTVGRTGKKKKFQGLRRVFGLSD